MFSLFPAEEAPSVYGFDFEKVYREGIRGLIFDIDNTLVPHDAPIDERAEQKLLELKDRGFLIMIVSNNGEERVGKFAGKAGIPYICNAGKPKAEGYERAVRKMGISKAQVLAFGDQIFTDTLGANLAGIRSVLVEPVDRSSDIPTIVLKRVLEKPVLYFYSKKLANSR